jgi:hypothetical protein
LVRDDSAIKIVAVCFLNTLEAPLAAVGGLERVADSIAVDVSDLCDCWPVN